MNTKVNLGKNSKVNVKWHVLPSDRTDELEDIIKSKMAIKYGIDKKNISIEPEFITSSGSADNALVNEASLNIQDPLFQQKLFKQFLDEKGYKDYDFDKILEIDNIINSTINYELYDKHKRYSFKWIKWSNFMSYGEGNYLDLSTLNGLVLLTSMPANQGGKTTFCLDLFRFLLFGKVTSREDDWTLSRAFNDHLPTATEVVVEGCITIDNEDYVIKRVLTRPALNKRTDKSKITQKLSYYKLIDGNYVDLVDADSSENLQGSTTTETNKLIKEAIGNERDFDLMICVNADNLKGLISLKDTERGRLMARWIGLLPIEEKDKNAREMFNKKIQPTLLLNKYNRVELESDIETLNNINSETEKELKSLEKKKNNSNKKISELNENRDTLLQSKRKIDENLMKTDVSTIKADNEKIIENGKRKKIENENDKNEYSSLKDITFDESDYKKKNEEKTQLAIALTNARNDCKNIKNEIDALKKGEYCPTCGAKLKNVDNTEIIANKTDKYNELIKDGLELKSKMEKLDKELIELEALREKYQKKLRLELKLEKNEVDIDNLRRRYSENNRILDDIKQNEEAITNNNKIDASINVVNVNIKTEEGIRDGIVADIESNKSTISKNKEKIKEYTGIVDTIKKEEATVSAWKLYLEMIGKNGISKMVLRNALPVINGELKRLLSDICDFDVEVGIDDHNDVTFYKIHDGVKANLGAGSGFEQTAASLALRSVLSNISTFSKPSFVVFDEILGGVADENYDNIRLLYEKIVKNYNFILQISHIKAIADWHSTNIIVKKEDNISSIERI